MLILGETTIVPTIDDNIIRRLEFRAQYDVECKLLDDPITKSTLQGIINTNFKQIEDVCAAGTVSMVIQPTYGIKGASLQTV